MLTLGRRRFLDDNVRVGPAEAERVHTHDARAIRLREWLERGVDAQLQSLEVDVRIGSYKMEIGRNLPVFDRQQRFYQAGDACSGLQMTDIRLHRADDERRFTRAVGA